LTCDQEIWARSLRSYCNWLRLNESVLYHSPSVVGNKYSDIQISKGLVIACCMNFDVLLTAHLIILAIDELNAQILVL